MLCLMSHFLFCLYIPELQLYKKLLAFLKMFLKRLMSLIKNKINLNNKKSKSN